MNTTETWEQRRERERKEKHEKCELFAAKMKKAFEICGLVYRFDDSDGFKDRVRADMRDSSKNAYISASIDRYGHSGRICIGLWYSNQLTQRDVWGYGSTHIEITVAETKSAEQIAADMKRRIIPHLAESIKKADEVLEKRSNYEEKTAKNVKMLGGKIERHGYNGEVNKTVYLKHGTLNVSGDSVTFERVYVTAEQAKKIVDLLNTFEEQTI